MENQQKINLRTTAMIALILIASLSRIIPHILNFSPIGAIALFGAAHFNKKWQSFLIPLAAIWLSDLFIMNVFYKQQHSNFIWFYQGFYWQYGCYILITFVGLFIFKKVNTERVLYGVLTSTIIFFLLTNFGCFPGNHLYTQNYRGLIACYVAGIPFIKGTLLGDLFYSTLLFGSFALLQHRFTILKPVIQNK